MAKKILISAFLVFLVCSTLFADTYDDHTLCSITVSSKEDLDYIYKLRLDIVGRKGDIYKAILTDEEMCLLQEKGIKFEILYDEMAKDRTELATPGYCSNTPFPCYYIASKFNTVNPPSGSLMEHLLNLYNAYPNIVRLYDIGDSQDGAYDIIAAKVTDNPDLEENEPEIRLYANIHGDEVSGMMVECDVLDWLLQNYSSNSNAQKLINEAELWFVPMGNPYGLMNRTRYNSHGVDLNRNFWGPAGCDDCYPDSTPCNPWTEKETQAIRDLTEIYGKRFVTSISFHAGEICFNAVYNYTSTPTSDEPIFFESRTGGPNGEADPSPYGLAQAYMDGCTTSGFWYTNGADWYITKGDTNDWSYNQWSDLDTTLEVTTTKWPDPNQIATYTSQHRQAVINYMLKTFQGISGIMSDCETGQPLDGAVVATCTSTSSPYITVPHQYKEVFTDPDVGDFHRVLEPGTYTIECFANGYASTIIPNVFVAPDQTTTVNCDMCKTRLSYQNCVINDSCNGVSGDGIIDAGENVVLQVNLINTGVVTATGVSAILSTNSSGVVILNNVSNFPNIAGGSSGASVYPHFVFKTDSNLACGTLLNFTLHITSDQGSWDSTFSLSVGNTISGTQSSLWSQSFDATTFPPTGWGIKDVAGSQGNWARATNTVHPSGGGTHSGAGLAYFNSYTAQSGYSTRLYRNLATTIPSGASSANVVFWMFHDTGNSANDRLQIQISTDGTNWSNIGSEIKRNDGSYGWKEHKIDVSNYIGQNVYVGILGISAYGNDCHIDDVSLTFTSSSTCEMTVCESAQEPPQEVAVGSSYTWNGQIMQWTSEPTASGYRVYRGTKAQLSALCDNGQDFCQRNDTA
ncbi:MAG: DUF2817 domain-containing protein, partial [Acidobacteriota bacterium]